MAGRWAGLGGRWAGLGGRRGAGPAVIGSSPRQAAVRAVCRMRAEALEMLLELRPLGE